MSLETWRETSWSSLTILTVSGDYLAAVARVGAGVPGWVLGSCHVLTTPASGSFCLYTPRCRHQALMSSSSDTTNITNTLQPQLGTHRN